MYTSITVLKQFYNVPRRSLLEIITVRNKTTRSGLCVFKRLVHTRVQTTALRFEGELVGNVLFLIIPDGRLRDMQICYLTRTVCKRFLLCDSSSCIRRPQFRGLPQSRLNISFDIMFIIRVSILYVSAVRFARNVENVTLTAKTKFKSIQKNIAEPLKTFGEL